MGDGVLGVRWTRRGLASLNAVTDFIARDNPLAARKFAAEAIRQTDLLGAHPGIGRPGRVPGTRELVIHKNYIVPYRVKASGVEILRVHHAARLWPGKF